MLSVVEKFFAGAFALIALYLLVINPAGANQIIQAFGGFTTSVFGTLQGRTVSGPGGVSVGGLANRAI